MVNHLLFRQHALHRMDLERIVVGSGGSDITEWAGEDAEMGSGREQPVHCVWH
jgi:hypothetical protein